MRGKRRLGRLRARSSATARSTGWSRTGPRPRRSPHRRRRAGCVDHAAEEGRRAAEQIRRPASASSAISTDLGPRCPPRRPDARRADGDGPVDAAGRGPGRGVTEALIGAIIAGAPSRRRARRAAAPWPTPRRASSSTRRRPGAPRLGPLLGHRGSSGGRPPTRLNRRQARPLRPGRTGPCASPGRPGPASP